ncbi:MAG: flagellin N-terminal helical domain-containing protein [Sporichthyaceae bacterium]
MTVIGRVTQRSMAAQTMANLQGNLSRMADLQERMSSGKQISRPSDSPTGTVSAMQLRSEIRDNQQWSRNADDGLGWLGTIDQTLTSALESTRRARNLTVAGLNAGAMTPAAAEAIALEVDSLRSGLLGLANTRYLDRPVFGGTTGGASAYDAAGAYLGPASSPPVLRTVGASTGVRVDQTGPEVFGPAGADAFTVLAEISAALRAGDQTALRAGLGNLDVAMNRISGRLAESGAAYNRLEQLQTAADDRVLTLRTALSDVEDIDLPATIVELSLAQVAQQAALAATQKVITPSLVDFLR